MSHLGFMDPDLLLMGKMVYGPGGRGGTGWGGADGGRRLTRPTARRTRAAPMRVKVVTLSPAKYAPRNAPATGWMNKKTDISLASCLSRTVNQTM